MTDLNGLKLYTRAEAAEILQVTPRTVLTHLNTGKLRGTKTGHAWIITENAIREFLGEKPKPETHAETKKKKG